MTSTKAEDVANNFQIPDEVMEASMTFDPETIFKAAANHYTPKLVGMATVPPYSGAGIYGFIEHITGKGHVVFNGFMMNYYDNVNVTNRLETRYLGLDDLMAMSFRPFNQVLAAQLQVCMEIKHASGSNTPPPTSNVPSGFNTPPPHSNVPDADSDADWEVV